MIIILIFCGNHSVKKMRFQQVRRSVLAKLSRQGNVDWRKQDNGYYNTKPNDENHIKKCDLGKKLRHEWIHD